MTDDTTTAMTTAMTNAQSPVRLFFQHAQWITAGQRGQRRLLPAHVELRQNCHERAHGRGIPGVREPCAVPGVRLVSRRGRQVRTRAACRWRDVEFGERLVDVVVVAGVRRFDIRSVYTSICTGPARLGKRVSDSDGGMDAEIKPVDQSALTCLWSDFGFHRGKSL